MCKLMGQNAVFPWARSGRRTSQNHMLTDRIRLRVDRICRSHRLRIVVHSDPGKVVAKSRFKPFTPVVIERPAGRCQDVMHDLGSKGILVCTLICPTILRRQHWRFVRKH